MIVHTISAGTIANWCVISKTIRSEVRGARTTELKQALIPTAASTIASSGVNEPGNKRPCEPAQGQGRRKYAATPTPAVGEDRRGELGDHQDAGGLPYDRVV